MVDVLTDLSYGETVAATSAEFAVQFAGCQACSAQESFNAAPLLASLPDPQNFLPVAPNFPPVPVSAHLAVKQALPTGRSLTVGGGLAGRHAGVCLWLATARGGAAVTRHLWRWLVSISPYLGCSRWLLGDSATHAQKFMLGGPWRSIPEQQMENPPDLGMNAYSGNGTCNSCGSNCQHCGGDCGCQNCDGCVRLRLKLRRLLAASGTSKACAVFLWRNNDAGAAAGGHQQH